MRVGVLQPGQLRNGPAQFSLVAPQPGPLPHSTEHQLCPCFTLVMTCYESEHSGFLLSVPFLTLTSIGFPTSTNLVHSISINITSTLYGYDFP